tara:strand:- start:787 stop:912 length:126 start_codon:yes stop_codon:yes gene_type:complete
MLGLTTTITIAIGIFFILVLTSVIFFDIYMNIKSIMGKDDE